MPSGDESYSEPMPTDMLEIFLMEANIIRA